jgi:oligopeptidase A
VVINMSNFQAPVGGKPVLLRHYDVETLFHEFGHALHALLSEPPYVNLSGFLTEWDFIELPSQLMENWTWEPKSLERFARHYKTRKTLSPSLLTSLRRSREFMAGYGGCNHTMHALLDLELHLQEPPASVAALDALCKKVYTTYAILPVPPGARMHATFHHLFGGGYAAGYYSYIWAEILEADIFGRFRKEGILSRRTGEALRREVLAPGAQRPGADLFAAFMGRPPAIDALLRKHGVQNGKASKRR